MKILVVYASRHGATKTIAERIAVTLGAAGHQVAVRPAKAAGEPSGFDAFVIGSAAYFGHWRKEALQFARQNRDLLAERPVWLFSSGPLGTESMDARGQDPRQTAEPAEIAALNEAIRPRDHHVFFGALDPSKLGFRERVIRAMPAGHRLLPEGDFRDWQEIEAWAAGIAVALVGEPASAAEV
jgi:menaquinone-dependent protoporphyrinogen oxidase